MVAMGLARLRPWYFSLRTMFVAVALVAVFLAYHANWIHQRHAARMLINQCPSTDTPQHRYTLMPSSSLPWTLRLMGERGKWMVWLLTDDPPIVGRIRSLYPESIITVSVEDKAAYLAKHQ